MVRFNPDWFQMQEDAYLDKINQNEIMMAESSRNSHTTPLCCSQEKIMVASSFQWCGGSPPSLSLARFLLSLYLSSSWISLVFFLALALSFGIICMLCFFVAGHVRHWKPVLCCCCCRGESMERHCRCQHT